MDLARIVPPQTPASLAKANDMGSPIFNIDINCLVFISVQGTGVLTPGATPKHHLDESQQTTLHALQRTRPLLKQNSYVYKGYK